MLKPGGRMVTIVDVASKDAFFIVEPNQKQLVEVAKLLDAGDLKTYVGAVVPLAEASNAYSGAVPSKRRNGKVVILIDQRT
jgi:NADPH:quinone reductase-like Zn-dependent oxidoreductase